jgi:hypothetical protein
MQNTMKNIIFLVTACFTFSLLSCSKASDAGASAAGSSNGSLTRFITAGNYLYVVDNSKLHTYSIINPAVPEIKYTTQVGFAIQTIFVYKDKLFIGSNNNMYIYSISNPEKPAQVAEVTYFVRGRDPIVANDSVAYSTVRNEFGPGGVLNVFNIKNITQPLRLGSQFMANPYGLSMKDSALYVCEADSGLKVFNIKNTYAPVIKTTLKNTETFYDIIIEGNILVCYIKGGLCFVDISSPFKPAVMATVKN